MAIDKNSNSFTFIFATIMVVVVGTSLAVAFMGLKPYQDDNVRKEKMQNILAAVNVEVARDAAPEMYKTIVKESFVINSEGKVVEGVDAFGVDVLKEYKQWKAGARDPKDMHYPLFICQKGDTSLNVIPMVGTGLWGPIWGYISVLSDHNTVYGSTYDHKGETPGLGAEITMSWFESRFKGKKILNEQGAYASINVVKAGAATDPAHDVDGITGGTITSVGVDEMLDRTLAIYNTYFKSL